MNQKVNVRSLMVTDVHSVGRNDPLAAVDELMRNHDIRHVPVLDEYGRPCGMISQRDIFRGAILRALGYGQRAEALMLESTVAKEVMRTELVTVAPDASIEEAARLMLDHKIGALVVVDEERLVGLLSESDLLRVLAGEKT